MKAEYISHMGTDNTVADAARVSFSKTSENFTDAQNKGLIQFLARGCMKGDWDTMVTELSQGQGTKEDVNALLKHVKNMPTHFSPFTHPQITLLETVPIFVARQTFKHQIGFTRNEVSRRYVDDIPEFHMPESWRSRPVGGIKQGSAGTHLSNDYHRGNYAGFIEAAQSLYENMIEDGVAPEQARMVLPQSMLTTYWVTGSLYAWANAYIQRSDAHAQVEIQQLAAQWDTIIQPLFPESWKALTK
jgi:thymidylate synthase (FAD)